MSDVLMEVRHLSKYFSLKTDLLGRPASVLKAVDDVSLSIRRGEAFGLVGESGCGKTTFGKCLVNLYRPTRGEILYGGKNLTAISGRERREYCRDIQLIFQDPYSSLNPAMTVGEIIAEPIRINRLLPRGKVKERVDSLLQSVGLSPEQGGRYPSEFSGGQRQRVGIARALAVQPKLIVCDEPVSALDVSVQAQVLNLLADLKEEFGLTYLFIAHGLNVVRHISDRTGVMYLGRIVETAEGDELYERPLHPYTQALFSAAPAMDPAKRKKHAVLKGEAPSPIDPPEGCRFFSRCPKAGRRCSECTPELREVSPGHFVACHLYDRRDEKAPVSIK